MYNTKGHVPEKEYTIPLGTAEVKRKGKDVTIVAWSKMVLVALEAAGQLRDEGIDVEIIDLRTLSPLDIGVIINSVKKTGRLVTCEEGCKTGGVGGEIWTQVSERIFDFIDAPVVRISAKDTPIPYSPVLEKATIPDITQIIKGVKETLHLDII